MNRKRIRKVSDSYLIYKNKLVSEIQIEKDKMNGNMLKLKRVQKVVKPENMIKDKFFMQKLMQFKSIQRVLYSYL